MSAERFFLDQDQSSHWYIVPAAKRTEWDAWRDLPDDDEASWEAPIWSRRLDGSPTNITFSNPEGT